MSEKATITVRPTPSYAVVDQEAKRIVQWCDSEDEARSAWSRLTGHGLKNLAIATFIESCRLCGGPLDGDLCGDDDCAGSKP